MIVAEFKQVLDERFAELGDPSAAEASSCCPLGLVYGDPNDVNPEPTAVAEKTGLPIGSASVSPRAGTTPPTSIPMDETPPTATTTIEGTSMGATRGFAGSKTTPGHRRRSEASQTPNVSHYRSTLWVYVGSNG